MDEKEKEILSTEHNSQTVDENVDTEEKTGEEITEEVREEALPDGDTAEKSDSEEAEKYVSEELLPQEVITLRAQVESLKKKVKVKNILLSVILAVVAVALAAVIAFSIVNRTYNPYNHMGYSNFSGMTIQDVADEQSISLDELKNIYDLPDDMKGDTYWDAAQYMIPLYSYEMNYGVSVEQMKEQFGFADFVTRDYSIGEAYDTAPISKVVGEGDEFNKFIEKYGFDESVTPETPWGDVRKAVDKFDYAEYQATLATEVEDTTETEDVSEIEDMSEVENISEAE